VRRSFLLALIVVGILAAKTVNAEEAPTSDDPLRDGTAQLKAGDLNAARTLFRLAVGGDPTPQLIAALQLLQHPPPAGLERAAPRELLDWAIGAWRPQQRLRTLRELIASP